MLQQLPFSSLSTQRRVVAPQSAIMSSHRVQYKSHGESGGSDRLKEQLKAQCMARVREQRLQIIERARHSKDRTSPQTDGGLQQQPQQPQQPQLASSPQHPQQQPQPGAEAQDVASSLTAIINQEFLQAKQQQRLEAQQQQSGSAASIPLSPSQRLSQQSPASSASSPFSPTAFSPSLHHNNPSPFLSASSLKLPASSPPSSAQLQQAQSPLPHPPIPFPHSAIQSMPAAGGGRGGDGMSGMYDHDEEEEKYPAASGYGADLSELLSQAEYVELMSEMEEELRREQQLMMQQQQMQADDEGKQPQQQSWRETGQLQGEHHRRLHAGCSPSH